MLNATAIKGLAGRLEKAQELVDAGAVFPVAGLEGYAVVQNGDGTQMYMVEHCAGRERCTCPDFQHRQKASGLPCKHILAAQIAFGHCSEQNEADAPAKEIDNSAGIALLRGQRPVA